MDPFAALADPVRRDLVVRLAGGPARVVDLASGHAISRPAISRHLRLLTQAGLVSAEDRGRERHYRLERGGLEPVADLLTALRETPVPPIADADLDGLELEVRRAGRDRRTNRTHTQEDTA
ncbi:regulatory protein, arsR family [Nocardioides exalbidus]|uniref:Regulatory protein, arsR family n=1 Tax=Nocardioides exalbidus TaxID=402596 RepID=A0A1H4K4T0_9ACTN|nr:metalloregulator ArsR/SmtB family transcription factor [Nocardioides exalbidus]SEB53108.1 regulatory protein, arsR family [Nocardioides exalbidus]